MCCDSLVRPPPTVPGPAMTIRPGPGTMEGDVSKAMEGDVSKMLVGKSIDQGTYANGGGDGIADRHESQRFIGKVMPQARDTEASTPPPGKSAADPLERNGGNGAAESHDPELKGRQEMLSLVEELKGMDELNCFIEPVDDSFAPGYSKIILRPMSFSVMLKKAKNGEYPLVKDLMEDLELICYNAMKYNAKRSKIYNAASLLLKKGKKHVRAFTAAKRPAELERKTDGPDKRGTQGQAMSKIKTRREMAKAVEEKEETAKSRGRGGDVDVVGGEANQSALREDRFDGSTECSSSYAQTASESEDEWGYNPETSSKFRGDERDAEGREKRPLNPEWKKQRRGIEWRARWLEVRMVDIQEKAEHYNHLAKQMKSRRKTHALRPVMEKVPGSLLESPPLQETSLQAPLPLLSSPTQPAPQLAPAVQAAADTEQQTEAAPSLPDTQQAQVQATDMRKADSELPAVSLPAQPPASEAPEAPAPSSSGPPPGEIVADLAPAVSHVSQRAGEVAVASAPAVGHVTRQVASTAARVELEAVQIRERDQPLDTSMPDDSLVGRVKQSLRHHRKRKKLEEEPVMEARMAAHPLFSRYDKASRKRPRTLEDDEVSMADVDLRSMSPGYEPPPERVYRPYLPPLPAVLEDEPMDCLLEKVEALQQRLHQLRAQLHFSAANRVAPPRRIQPQTPRPPSGQAPLPTPRPYTSQRPSPSPSPRNAPSPSPMGRSMLSPSSSGSPRAELERTRSAILSSGGGAGAMQRSMSGTALIPGRRRTADYDISNVVSSVAVGRKTVEQLQHTKIETPRWTLVQQTFDELVGGESSDEDTDDEAYARRHEPLEAQEKLRYMPPPSKHQGMGKPTGKGKEKPPTSARGNPHHDGGGELMSPRSPSYKRRKAGKNENGVVKGKAGAHAKALGLPPAGPGKATAGKGPPTEVAAAGAETAGGGEPKLSQDEMQKRRASPGLTIQIPDTH